MFLKRLTVIPSSPTRRAGGEFNTEQQMKRKSWRISFFFSHRARQIISQNCFCLSCFFSAPLCFTVILPCPRISPLYDIKRQNRQLLNFHVIIWFHKMHANTWFLHEKRRRSFCGVSVFWSFPLTAHSPAAENLRTLFLFFHSYPSDLLNKKKKKKSTSVYLPRLSLTLLFSLSSLRLCLLCFAMRSSAQEDALVAQG